MLYSLLAQNSGATMSAVQWFYIGLVLLGGVGIVMLLMKMKPQT